MITSEEIKQLNKNFNVERFIESDRYAYMQCGSSPCEDCDKYRHDENKSVEIMDCYENGGCTEKIAYDHDYEMFKQEYLKRHNSK